MCGAVCAPAQGLRNPFFAFDNGTGRDQKVPVEEQAQLLRRTGYDGIGYSGTQEIPRLLAALDARGLKLFSIYVGCRIEGEAPSCDPGLPQAIRQLKGRDTLILITVIGRVPDADERTVRLAREVADMAATSSLRVALYPHYGMHVARVEDALRIVAKAGRKNLGISFNLCHWLRSGDEANMQQRLREALPHLYVVSINGADHQGDWDRLIQPLDRGEFDVYGFLKALTALGYKGPVGLQCYKVPGDNEENLKRSMAAWRGFSARLAAE